MKKLFGMIAIVLLFSSTVFAGTKLLNETLIKGKDHYIKFAVRTICVDGYKFVVTRDLQNAYEHSSKWGSVSISTTVSTVQFYENQNGKAVPAKC